MVNLDTVSLRLLGELRESMGDKLTDQQMLFIMLAVVIMVSLCPFLLINLYLCLMTCLRVRRRPYQLYLGVQRGYRSTGDLLRVDLRDARQLGRSFGIERAGNEELDHELGDESSSL